MESLKLKCIEFDKIILKFIDLICTFPKDLEEVITYISNDEVSIQMRTRVEFRSWQFNLGIIIYNQDDKFKIDNVERILSFSIEKDVYEDEESFKDTKSKIIALITAKLVSIFQKYAIQISKYDYVDISQEIVKTDMSDYNLVNLASKAISNQKQFYLMRKGEFNSKCKEHDVKSMDKIYDELLLFCAYDNRDMMEIDILVDVVYEKVLYKLLAEKHIICGKNLICIEIINSQLDSNKTNIYPLSFIIDFNTVESDKVSREMFNEAISDLKEFINLISSSEPVIKAKIYDREDEDTSRLV